MLCTASVNPTLFGIRRYPRDMIVPESRVNNHSTPQNSKDSNEWQIGTKPWPVIPPIACPRKYSLTTINPIPLADRRPRVEILAHSGRRLSFLSSMTGLKLGRQVKVLSVVRGVVVRLHRQSLWHGSHWKSGPLAHDKKNTNVKLSFLT